MKKIVFIILLFFVTRFIFAQTYSWKVIPSGTTNNLYSVFYYGYNGWIVGASGTILFTSNGGFNWVFQNSGTTSDLHSVFLSQFTLYVAGANGTILQSSNNGSNWVVRNTGTTNSLNSICCLTDPVAVGNSGTFLISTDYGVNWGPRVSGTNYDLNYIFNRFIVGSNGTILHSTDAYSSWIPQSSGTYNTLNEITQVSMNEYWVVGAAVILKTTNYGDNWISVPSNTAANLKSIAWDSNTSGWIVGSGGTILRTTDWGNNWTQQNSITSIDLNSCSVSSGKNSIIVGNNGLILLRILEPAYYTNLSGNNISSFFYYKGIFDNNPRIFNYPGFEWPKGSGSDAVYSAGLSTAALYNGSLRMASAMYSGEYLPGYVIDSSGIPVAQTDGRFRFYSVKRGDNMYNNPDWLDWGDMVPYGAPFIDVNKDGIYEPAIDTPGMPNASQTIFLCMTDGFPNSHIPFEGFGGGTPPLYVESHMTAWCYDIPELSDVQFIKWNVINKSHTTWNNTYFSITSDPDLGCPSDDYIGCDTTRNLAFCYNGEDNDCSYGYRYNSPLPAVGFIWLRNHGRQDLGMTSMVYFQYYPGSPLCAEPDPGADKAYNYMKGTKMDGTPWMIPPGGSPQFVTKFIYSGDPESGQGWCEAESQITGSFWNCGGPGHYTGEVHSPNIYGDRQLILNSGSDNLTINPGDTQKIMIAQLIARGSSRKNSVTKLKILADTIRAYYNSGYINPPEPIVKTIPARFYLYQNYPNPFNSSTKIKFDIPPSPLQKERGLGGEVKLIVYDILGRKVASLIPPLWLAPLGGGQEGLAPGTYEVTWDAGNYASGVYFYKLTVGSFTAAKKLVLLK